ncbi:oligosaccharide flippase family protein [uncultured Polaribacter sp.]|uniref:oligosaccharide flippase family protein n=1 Tax=uncultured Polaribacter sp. TaxID=174711 RepID=UPI0026282ADB|nr:oligosaccharide flippase family protein [uncultured Polaribacter sp.]
MNLFKNKIFIYTSSRYLTYGLHFLNSLLIARFLGVFYLGIWGFVMLVLQYLLRMNFGISNSINAIVSINKNNSSYVSQVIGIGVTLLFILSALILFFFSFLYFFSIDFGTKYSFEQYLVYIIAIAILSHFNLFFSNIFRVYGKLSAITFNQTILPVLTFLSIFFFEGKELLIVLIRVYLLSSVLSIMFYLFTSPVSFKPIINRDLAKKVLSKAFYLFIYNACFYLIIIVTRTFVSDYFTIEEFGYFTFAFTLASAVLLIFESMSFLIFPKLLNRFSQKDNLNVVVLLDSLRDSYVSISHLSMHVVILFYPFCLLFFPEFISTGKVFVFTALTVVITTNLFGYQGLMIAREKEKTISFITVFALILNLILNYIFINFFKFQYEYVMLATMITYFIYIFIVSFYGRNIIYNRNNFKATFLDVFPLKWMIPFLSSMFITFLYDNYIIFYLIPVILFFILNTKGLINSFKMARNIFANSKVLDV